VANDTQPNKLYRNQHNGTFKDAAVEAGLAFSSEGKARAGMGVDVADFDNSGTPGVAITTSINEMIGLYRATARVSKTSRRNPGWASPPGTAWVLAALFWTSTWMLARLRRGQWTHRRDRAQHSRQRGICAAAATLSQSRQRNVREVAAEVGGSFDRPKSAADWLMPTLIGDGDLDLLITTNNGLPTCIATTTQRQPQHPFSFSGNQVNRDAIGAVVRSFAGGTVQSRLVKGGSSYLSQSELPVTFGLEKRNRIDRVVIDWPSGRTEEYKNLAAGRCYECTEGKGIVPQDGY